MTDRIGALTVALDRDIRIDEIQPLIQAIKCLRGVLNVTAEKVNGNTWAAAGRAKYELERLLLDALQSYRAIT